MRVIATAHKSAAVAPFRWNWMTQRFLKQKRSLQPVLIGAPMVYSSANGRHHSLDKRLIALHRNMS